MRPKEVFTLYNEYLKPLYCEVEANNKLPMEVLFEIHAAFDHLKRIYIDKENESRCCEKACSHIKRATLDAYKIILKRFTDR